MSAYFEPVKIAAILFIVAAFILFIPWLVYTYRKYGFLSLSKSLVIFSFIFYFMAALFLVLLPLPETTNTCAIQKPGTQFYNLTPFQFIIDIRSQMSFSVTSMASWKQLLTLPAFYQAMFNFLLLLPFGVYLRYFLKKRQYWVRAFFIGLALTLFYEVTQVTGIYGIYNCPYRIFDVDDLMLNSLGSITGFFIAPVILIFFPKHIDVVAKAEELQAKQIVKPLHVIVALIVDFFIVNFLTSLFGTQSILLELMIGFGLYTILFGVIPTFMNNATLGMKILKLKMTSQQPLKKAIWRRTYAILVVYFILMMLRLVNQIELNMDSNFYELQIVLTLLSFFISMVIYLFILWNIIRFIFTKGKKPLFFDEYSHVVVARKNKIQKSE